MRLSVRSGSLLIAAASALALGACKDSPTSGIRPASLSVVSGDGDSGVAGDQIVLEVRVTGSDDRTFEGAAVTWSILSGPGTLAFQSTASGSDGIAANTVTLGIAGATVVRATAEGAGAVLFSVTSLDPCTVFRDLAVDVTFNGSLATTDCQITDGTRIDFYQFTLAAQADVAIAMSSTAFDTFIFLFDSTGLALAVDDDGAGGGTTNSRLRALLAAGTYIAGANAFDPGRTVGPYSFEVQQTSSELNACEVPWTVRGVATSQQLTTAPCDTPDGMQLAADHLLIVLEAGQKMTLAMTSAAFDARVAVFDGSGTPLAAATAGAPGATASMQFTAPASDLYVVQLSAVGGATGGAYQLSIQ
ncbi:MAG: PPC domain-containing protein [Gemmatimonadetes bacterium]|nr:PPC domain-containing protein [Gemmatimonadota bacterium]